MSILAKVALSIVIVVVGVIIAAIAKESIGAGQYLIHGIIVIAIMYLWSK
jgi:hypothetical protein